MSDKPRVVKSAARICDGNPEPRVPCVVLLDRSSSMLGDKIQQLNAGLETLPTELLKNEVAARRVELAVVTFGGKVEVAQDFVLPTEFRPPVIKAEGDTPMGAAILRAYDLLEQRQARYEASDLDSYGPWVFMVTDGEPTDSAEVLAKAAQRIRQGERQERRKQVAFFPVGVDGANMERLAQISVRSPLMLRGYDYAKRHFYYRTLNRRAWGQKLLSALAWVRPPVARVPRKVWVATCCIVVIALLALALLCWPRSTEPRPERSGEQTTQQSEQEVGGEETPWMWREAQRLNRMNK